MTRRVDLTQGSVVRHVLRMTPPMAMAFFAMREETEPPRLVHAGRVVARKRPKGARSEPEASEVQEDKLPIDFLPARR